MVITEKIDGTNAAVGVMDDGTVYAQSRTRIITPESDNFGFARWVSERAPLLAELLGPGIHFGEWWGNGIQRGYGLPNGDKRFSLFNASRWREAAENNPDWWGTLTTVPVLYEGLFSQEAIEVCLNMLREFGSRAAPRFMDPEGIVVYMAAARTMFKVTLKNDEQPKGQSDDS
jgi:hypothetical protein